MSKASQEKADEKKRKQAMVILFSSHSPHFLERESLLLNKWASSFNKFVSLFGAYQVDAAKEKKSENKSSFKEANAKAEKKMEETKNE